MGHDDVIGQMVRDMQTFLAESAFVHVQGAATQLEVAGQPRGVVVDLASWAARRRTRDQGRTGVRHPGRAAQHPC